MTAYTQNLAALNHIIDELEGSGGDGITYTQGIKAYNAIAILLGGDGGHTQNIQALNEISGLLGGATNFTQNIQALNAISGAIGGATNFTQNIAALNEIAEIGLTPAGPADDFLLLADAVSRLLLANGTDGILLAEVSYRYVDSAVASSGNGLTWATAWKQPTDIDWGTIDPNTTILFSFGTYVGGLVVGADGASGQPITIRSTVDSGHAGTVVHDGQNARICIDTNGHDHIVIKDMTARNTNDCCVYVDAAAAGVIVEGMTVVATGPGGGNARGIDVRHCSGALSAIVRNNTITTHANSTDQTDCIYAQDNGVGSVEIHDNSITMSNADNTGHSDGIQLVDNGSLAIYNNVVEVVNGGADNHGIFTQNCRTGSTYTFRNNVIAMRGATSSFALTHENQGGFAGKAVAYNNSIYGGTRGINYFNAPAANEAKNNIIYPQAAGVGFFIQSATVPSAANIQNNLIYAPSATVGDVNGVSKSWAAWQALGYDTAGVNANPQFVDVASDFRLRDGSPAANAGVTLAAVPTDILGVSRPVGAAYDIGAYEGTVGT